MKSQVTVRMAVSRVAIVSKWQSHCHSGRAAIMAGRADNVAVWNSLILSEWQGTVNLAIEIESQYQYHC